MSLATLFDQGPSAAAPIEFRIYGPSLETMQALGETARKVMLEVPGVLYTQASLNIAHFR